MNQTNTEISELYFSLTIMSYILSIDIGIHNLGYSIMNTNMSNINFGIFDLDKHIQKSSKNIVLDRIKYISMFIKQIFDKLNITKVIIERQVNNNTMAMELMYCIASTCYQYCSDIVIFDPKLKFTKLRINYDTKNKNHKKLSIKIMRNYITKYYPKYLDKFNSYDKQDDIADSLFMLLININEDNITELNKILECNK